MFFRLIVVWMTQRIWRTHRHQLESSNQSKSNQETSQASTKPFNFSRQKFTYNFFFLCDEAT